MSHRRQLAWIALFQAALWAVFAAAAWLLVNQPFR